MTPPTESERLAAENAELRAELESVQHVLSVSITNRNAIIDEALELRAELTEIRKWWDTGEGPPSPQTIRAAALEEAAQIVNDSQELASRERACVCADIRALSSLPPSLVAVPRAVVEQVKAALLGLSGRVAVLAESPNRRQALEQASVAIAALEVLK